MSVAFYLFGNKVYLHLKPLLVLTAYTRRHCKKNKDYYVNTTQQKKNTHNKLTPLGGRLFPISFNIKRLALNRVNGGLLVNGSFKYVCMIL